MNYVNLGCGRRFQSNWTNIDFTSTGHGVLAHDLSKGIPLPNESCDLVYHSHVLEHFTKDIGELFLKECWRILRHGGVIRIAVPDLEQITRTYLFSLGQARAGDEQWAMNYEWMVLELYDQTVRSRSGGELGQYLTQPEIPNEEFIIQRWGTQARTIIEASRQYHQQSDRSSGFALSVLLKDLYKFFCHRISLREHLVKLLLGNEYDMLKLGRFRHQGEIHQWMYDSYSLEKILRKLGFEQIIQRTATESYTPEWSRFNLDTESDGTIYKPDSFYMEAIKSAP